MFTNVAFTEIVVMKNKMICRTVCGIVAFQSKWYNTSASFCQAAKWTLPSGEATNIRVYNPITKTKVPVVLKNWNYVTWYMCGPTVYDSAHLGHASCYVKFDIIRKILTNFFGLHVVQGMSITDVDDKIVERAAQIGEDVGSVARRYSLEFFQDMASLGVEPPSLRLAVTDHIPHIVDFVQALVDKQTAYSSNGSVYFDTGGHAGYGKLSGLCMEEEGQLSADKRSPRDFALWKAAKMGEPAWHSPWGMGRPGWHVECSAMASAAFGRSVDLHSGGLDLLFPHHENEEAQSCAFHGTPQWVNYWLHAGPLHVAGDHKMSKSVGNTVSVRELLSRYSPAQFRLFCLLSHYRRGIEYSHQAMEKSVGVCRRLEDFLHDCGVAVQTSGCVDASLLLQKLAETQRQLVDALADDFDTGTGLTAVMDLVAVTNQVLRQRRHQDPEVATGEVGVLAAVAHFVRDSLARLGVHLPSTAHDNVNQTENAVSVEAVLDAVVQFRSRVRSAALQQSSGAGERQPLLQACDELRRDLRLAGVTLKDHGQLSSWSFSSRTS